MNSTLVPVTLQVGTILQIYTCPPCCRQPFSSAPATKAFPFFCPIYYPFPGSVLSAALLLLFALWHSLSFARDQSLTHWLLPAHWSWPPQSRFQSLNTGVARGETDSCYPVLRKTFRQSKPITSVTSIAWSHSVLSPHRNLRHHHKVNFVFAPKLPRGMQHARFPSFTMTNELQACF